MTAAPDRVPGSNDELPPTMLDDGRGRVDLVCVPRPDAPAGTRPVDAPTLAARLRADGVVAAVLAGSELGVGRTTLVRLVVDAHDRVLLDDGGHAVPGIGVWDLATALATATGDAVLVDGDDLVLPDGGVADPTDVDLESDVRSILVLRSGADEGFVLRDIASAVGGHVIATRRGPWCLVAIPTGTHLDAPGLAWADLHVPAGRAAFVGRETFLSRPVLVLTRAGRARRIGYLGRRRARTVSVTVERTVASAIVTRETEGAGEVAALARMLAHPGASARVDGPEDPTAQALAALATSEVADDDLFAAACRVIGAPELAARLLEESGPGWPEPWPEEHVLAGPGGRWRRAFESSVARSEELDDASTARTARLRRFLRRHPATFTAYAVVVHSLAAVLLGGVVLDLAGLAELDLEVGDVLFAVVGAAILAACAETMRWSGHRARRHVRHAAEPLGDAPPRPSHRG